MRLLLSVVGTRGDVQPVIAIAFRTVREPRIAERAMAVAKCIVTDGAAIAARQLINHATIKP